MKTNGKEQVLADFQFYLRAGYCYFYVETYEMMRAIKLLQEAVDTCQNVQKKRLYNAKVWDILTDPADPEAVIRQIKEDETGSVWFLKNFNWFLQDANGEVNHNLVTAMQNNYLPFTKKGPTRRAVVVVSDTPIADALPPALIRDFVPLNFNLPGEDEILDILEKTITAAKNAKGDFEEPDDKLKRRLVDAALGLSLTEVENSFAFCLVKEGRFVPSVIDKIKARMVQKVAGVSYAEYDSTFENLKGYEQIKKFCLGTARHKNAKGIIILGPAGTGKTEFCKCLANELGMRMVTWEMAEFQGGIVGETERKWREAIAVSQAMAGTQGVIVFMDEIEKGLSGSGRSATVSSDSITRRSAAQFLKFMQDPGCKIYFVATCNDVHGVEPAYLRAERWDTAPFFIDLPNADERKVILGHYMKHYDTKGKMTAKQTEGWSGAELRTVCRLADMMGTTVTDAKNFVVPVSQTMEKEIAGLRKWAKGKTISASLPVKIKKRPEENSRGLEL
jgi:AAA+ superfamily predicted ATPase